LKKDSNPHSLLSLSLSGTERGQGGEDKNNGGVMVCVSLWLLRAPLMNKGLTTKQSRQSSKSYENQGSDTTKKNSLEKIFYGRMCKI
jgi:hypothetical protein